MKLPNPYACDICGTRKDANNNWYQLYMTTACLVISPFDDSDTPPDDQQDLCGESCVIKAVAARLKEVHQQ